MDDGNYQTKKNKKKKNDNDQSKKIQKNSLQATCCASYELFMHFSNRLHSLINLYILMIELGVKY